MRLITMPGWGLTDQIFAALPWEKKNLPIEEWILLKPKDRISKLRDTIEEFSKDEPLVILALSLGAFLLHDPIVALLQNSKPHQLSGAVFCALASDFISPPDDSEHHSSPEAPVTKTSQSPRKQVEPSAQGTQGETQTKTFLKAMLGRLPLATSPEEQQENFSNATAMLEEFLDACLTHNETVKISEDVRHSLLLPCDEPCIQKLRHGLQFLIDIHVPAKVNAKTNKQNLASQQPDDAKPLPLITLFGTKDAIIHPAKCAAFAKTQGIRALRVAGAGHLLPLTHPDIVCAAIRQCGKLGTATK